MSGRFAYLRIAAGLAALIAATSPGQTQNMGATGYEVVSRGNEGMEVRFHNVPFKGVHADDAQNALAMDFQGAVDSAPFERLPADFPEWISMAYANYDNAVIRATRPVTFLTRAEPDGFSLRIVPRGAAPGPAPLAMRGPVDGPPQPMMMGPPPPQPVPPPPPGYGRYNAYGAIRNYNALQHAVNRNEPIWIQAHQRSAIQSDSELDFGTEYHGYHNGDRVITSHARAKVAVGGGLSLIGSIYDTDLKADRTRAQNGNFVVNTSRNQISGAAGLSLDAWDDSTASLEILQGNNITGAQIKTYTGTPDNWWIANFTYHQPYMDTPEAVLNRGQKDEVVLATGQHIGYGLWATAAAKLNNYGVHRNANAVKTAGWSANLRWSANLGGILAGLSYDGHGEYIWDKFNFTGAAPTPYVPLSIRNMETHSVTGSLSSLIWGDALWFDLYGGYITDRYASNGGIYGASLRYHPDAGVDLALGVRHSNVSLTQGLLGPETTAGLTFTLGFNGVPLGGYF